MVQAIIAVIYSALLSLFQDPFTLIPFPTEHVPSISTTSGSYVGTLNGEDGIETFLGIRYAQPPVGQLRFAAPVPITNPPVEPQDGTNFGNACAQQPLSEGFTLLFGSSSLGAGISEDCLFLNIYRPSTVTEESKYPILVFIHGGAYSVGAGSQYSGTSLVQRSIHNGSPIIFVTINYRLYVTGFLSSAHVSSEDLNAGLLDQKVALEFLRDNAYKLGGDPEKITVWGESAGASSIALQYLFTFSDGSAPFRAVIQDSGTGTILPVPSLETYDRPGGPFSLLLNLTGCTGRSNPVDCLRQMHIQDLLRCAGVIDRIIPQTAPAQTAIWIPSLGLEGSLITEPPSQRTLSGKFYRVPTMIGTNENEGTVFTLNWLDQERSLQNQTFHEFVTNRTFSADGIQKRTMQDIQKLFPVPPTATSLFDRLNDFVYTFHFHAPQRLLIDNAPKSQDIFVYKFKEPVPNIPDIIGVFHGAELSFLGMLNRTVPSVQSFADQYADYYLNFTVNLNPGPTWPKFDVRERKMLQLQNGNIMVTRDDENFHLSDYFIDPSIQQEFQR